MRVSAISQYRWHAPWKGGKKGESAQETAQRVLAGAEKLRENIVRHAEKLKAEVEVEGESEGRASEGMVWVLERLRDEGWVFDVYDAAGGAAGTEPENGMGDEVQLVKVNPFGAMSGCGSCLFHWIRDAEVLYGVREECEIRVAVEDEKIDNADGALENT